MNYLMHLYLAGADPELQLGGLMGDFVKGPLGDRYPPGILAGLQLHRRIDAFAAANDHCRISRQRLQPRFGHTRAVLVDIFYDHFLAVHWEEYHRQPLSNFACEIYQLLDDNRPILPTGLARIAPRMRDLDWLTSYRERRSVGTALQRMATRLSRPTAMGEGVTELDRCGEKLEGDFRGFMTAAKAAGLSLYRAMPRHGG